MRDFTTEHVRWYTVPVGPQTGTMVTFAPGDSGAAQCIAGKPGQSAQALEGSSSAALQCARQLLCEHHTMVYGTRVLGNVCYWARKYGCKRIRY